MTAPNEPSFTKINPDFKAKWVSALRSGAYTQARRALVIDAETAPGHHPKTRMCCIAVGAVTACHAVGAVTACRAVTACLDFDIMFATTTVAAAKCGIDAAAAARLVAMNDTEWKSFAEIADWIDANL